MTARPRGRAVSKTGRLLDGQRALHAGLLVAVDGAIELVRAGLQVDGHGRDAALVDRAAGLGGDPAALDAHRVWHGRRVVHLDRDVPRLGVQRALVELERAAWVRRDREL